MKEKEYRPEIIYLYKDILDLGLNIKIRVTGKSMEPSVRGGDVLYIKRADYNSLCAGDIIFFKDRYEQPVIHRIIRKIKDASGIYKFQTKGDSSIYYDDIIDGNMIIGKVYRIEKVKYNGKNCYIDLESYKWRFINYFIVYLSIFKAKFNLLRKV